MHLGFKDWLLLKQASEAEIHSRRNCIKKKLFIVKNNSGLSRWYKTKRGVRYLSVGEEQITVACTQVGMLSDKTSCGQFQASFKHYVGKDDIEFLILLHPSPKCWDCECCHIQINSTFWIIMD